MTVGESSTGSGGGFRSRLEYFLYSGDKKHVFAGIAIISVVFGAPWFFMNRGDATGVRYERAWWLISVIKKVQSINLIKITWKRLIKHGAKGSLLVNRL